MSLVHFRAIGTAILLWGWCAGGEEHDAALKFTQAPAETPSSRPKPSVQSKVQKVANPLNDLLEDAQRDIDKGNFEAAIAPLQRVIAEQPDFAYAHFQLAYVYTALKKTDEAGVEYGRTIAIGPKMSEAYLNLGRSLLDKQDDPPA